MTEFVQIDTTTPARSDAERIAEAMIARRLAGCVQISGPIQCTFRWQGRVEAAQEWLLSAKTAIGKMEAIERLLAELHPYEVPELIATPIVAGGEAYLKWLGEQLEPLQGGRPRAAGRESRAESQEPRVKSQEPGVESQGPRFEPQEPEPDGTDPFGA